MAQEYSRLFSVDEANLALDELRPAVARVVSARARLVSLQPSLASVLEKMLGNGGSRLTAELLGVFEELRAAIRRIEAVGALVKDLETGLIDFPSRRGEEVVFLCWRQGEPAVAHWHPVDAGFAGRRPL